MDSPLSSHEGLVCETCGAEGYTNAFIYCVKCLEFVIHRYCLHVIPKTNDEFVRWFCDDCKQPLSYDFLPPKHVTSQPRKENSPDSVLVEITRPKKKQQKNSPKKRKIDSLLEAGKGNERVSGPDRITRCIVLGLPRSKTNSNDQSCVETALTSLPKEALGNSDSGAKQIIPVPAELDNAELDNTCSPTKGTLKRKRDTIRVPAKTHKQNTERSTEPSSCESSCTDTILKDAEEIAHTEGGLQCRPDHGKLVSNSQSVEHELNERSKEFNGSAYAPQSSYVKNNIQYINDQHAMPEQDPVWRGSFKITGRDYSLFEGFVGHLSVRACDKVCEEATTLPSLLSLEMHLKADIWPKSFLDSMPDGENIALYFFPGDTKKERDFEQLVDDMIDDDLAMKATSKNAELLIFTSKALPQIYWRRHGNYYLWGVFKGKRQDVTDPKPSDNDALSPKSEKEEVTHEKEVLERVKLSGSHSPQNHLCRYR